MEKTFFQRMKARLKIPIPRPKIADETVQELALIAFFCMFGVGVWWIMPALSFIICGLMGMYFFYPRGPAR